MFKCVICGRELGWQSDFNLNEVYPDEAEYDDGVVGIYSCEKCEVDYEITTYAEQEHIKVILYERED